MADIGIDLPDRILSEIDRLVQQGEFLNRDQAVEELLGMGVSAYETTTADDTMAGGVGDDPFSQAVNDQQDPAMRDDDLGDY
jgi:metal-responsive CopG/Arc/MetJ family transcriptional regulator